MAGVSGNIECFEYLFGLPVMDEMKFELNGDGRTCLHVTVEWGHKEAMKYLIDECGFDPNLQDAVRCIPPADILVHCMLHCECNLLYNLFYAL